MKKDDNQIINILNDHKDILERHGDILERHEDNFNEIRNILNKHSEKFEGIDGKFDGIDKRLASVETTLTEVASLAIENKFEIREMKKNMMTKADKDEILSLMTKFIGRTESNEQQITIGGHQLRRTDKRVDKIEVDVKQIKPLVGLR